VTKRCLNCGEIIQNDSTRYCSNCGCQFPQNGSEVFLEIRKILHKSDKDTARFNKVILCFTIGSFVFFIISLLLNERDFILANPNATTNVGFLQSDLMVIIVIVVYAVLIFAMVAWIYFSEYLEDKKN
jgi:uncharacterized membrane protein YvbJ